MCAYGLFFSALFKLIAELQKCRNFKISRQCFEKPYVLAWSPLEINYRNRFRYQILVEFFLLSTLPYKAAMNFLCSLRDEQSTVDSSQPRLRAMSSRCRTRVHTFVAYFGSYAKMTNKGILKNKSYYRQKALIIYCLSK